MQDKIEFNKQFKSTDYPENTVLDFAFKPLCKRIFIDNYGTTTLQAYFKTIGASGYFRQIEIAPKYNGELPFEVNKIKEMRVETELGHAFKIETYI